MKHYFIEINESKVTIFLKILCSFMLALFNRHTFSKFQCVDEKRSSGGANKTKIGSMQKWKHGINQID